MTHHDLIVVGGGAAGLAAVRTALWAKADVVLVTDSPPGGDCTFTGCVPSKTLIAAARDGLDFVAAMERVRHTIQHIAATESVEVLRRNGARVIEGRGRLVTHDTVAVNEQRITAPRIVVATGSKPLMPSVEGLLEAQSLTTDNVFDLVNPPASLDIFGAGATGCELAQAFCDLGVDVTLFESASRVIPSQDPEASALVQSSLEARGVTVRTGTSIEAVEPFGSSQRDSSDSGERDNGQGDNSDSSERVSVKRDSSELNEGSTSKRLLLALGRQPETAGLGLQELGVKHDERGYVITDDRLATTVKGVYAAGDVTGRLLLTHAADEMGRLAAANALGKGVRGRFDAKGVPMVMFTDPEVASIGVSPQNAPRGARVAHLPMAEMDRAITDGRSDGYITLIAGPRRLLRNFAGGRIIGASIVGPRAGEMINEVALAMRTGAFTGRLAQVAHAYPTWSHGIQKTAAQFFGTLEGRSARWVR